MIITVARHTVRVSYLAIGVLLILLALFTVMARFGLPLVASQKSNIELRVSEYLKSPVAIGDLSVRWEGFGPLLQAKNVTVFESAERMVSLDELLIDINLAKSLLRGIPVINELSLVGASLAVESGSDGELHLHGMRSMARVPASADALASAGQGRGVDIIAWLFNARKVGLLDTRLTLIDVKTDSRVVIDELNIRAENQGDIHQLRIDAVLPEELGGRLEAGIDLTGNAQALSSSNGNVYLSAQSLNVGGLRALLMQSGLVDVPIQSSSALDMLASLELWGEWRDGQLVSVRGPLSVGAVVDAEKGNTLLDSLSMQLAMTRDASSIDFKATDILANRGLQTLQIDEMSLASKRTSQRLSTDLNADVLDANANANMSTSEANVSKAYVDEWQLNVRAGELRMDLVPPLADIALSHTHPALLDNLRNVSLDGVLDNLALQVNGITQASSQTPQRSPLINLSAGINGMSFDGAASSMPVIGPLNGEVSLIDSVGQLSLYGTQMPLSWSIANNNSLLVDAFDTEMDIDLSNTQRVQINGDLQIVDEGIDTDTRIKMTVVPGSSPHLHVQSWFDATDITALKDWMPGNLLKPAATRWIERAITAGSAYDGSLLFFGQLSDFPFDDGEGVLRASVDINDGSLAFLPLWPSATQINGKLELDGLRLTGVAENSLLDQFRVSKTRIAIPNLAVPILEVESTADGSLQDVVGFGVNGPLKEILAPAIGDVTGSGAAQMDLDLELSLYPEPAQGRTDKFARSWRPFQINGSLFLDGNDVKFGRADLEFNDATGAVNFDKKGISVNNLSAMLLGHHVNISGATEEQAESATTRLTLRGAVEANDLLADIGNPLDQFIRGASQWNATLSVPHSAQRIAEEGVGLTVSSDLIGTQLLLPQPFDKGTSTEAPFTLSTAFRGDDEVVLNITYADELRTRVKLLDGNLESVLVQLGGGLDEVVSDPVEQSGIRLQGRVSHLAADGWIETIARYIDSLPTGDSGPQPILPISMALDTDALILGRRSLGKASLRSNTDPTYLNFAITNQAIKGNMRYPRAHWQKDLALKARLELLDWSVVDALNDAGEELAGGRQSEPGLDPRILPPIEARVSTLVRDKIRIRDLVLRAQPNVSGLDVTTLGFAYDTMRLVGQGYWHLRDPQNVSPGLAGMHVSQLNLVLQSDDFGVGFDEIGLGGIIDDGQGSIEMKLTWPGPLYSPEIARLDGEVSINMQAGSIVPLEPGAGRVVGLFALQALPRRLDLDFKDLTGVGLAFKSIAGSAVIEDGVADVPLLQLTGPIGVVDIIGQSDLNTQEFNQQVTVLPRISAALPVIGAITGGASAGIGALVAAGFLKALGVDFDRIGLRTYKLTGPWIEPVFTSVPIDLSDRRQ